MARSLANCRKRAVVVRGHDLRRWLRAPPRPWTEIVDVYTQAARGLAAAHEAGLVHRDFKPHNALVGRDGRVRVVDFGLATEPAVISQRRSRRPGAARW